MMSKPILLLDDEEKFASMLQELLETHGYEAEYCLNPLEALNRIRSESFNLVISDYKMPQMDGARFLEEARKVDPDLPVIMISGLMNMPELIKVANIGVTLALEKPFRTEDLLESVQRFVSPGVARLEEEAVVSVPTEAVLSYPQPARLLADASEENQQFLESLWRVFQERIHLFMRVSRGAELRLVGEELLGWLGASEAEVLRIGLVDTQTDFTRGWILENLSRPGVFLVDMRSTTWNPESAGIFCDWIRFLDEEDGDLSRHRVLYALSSNAVLPHPLPGLPLSMQERFGEERPLLAALRDRLPDLVVYAQRLLMPLLWEQLGPSVRTMLLGYSWPGGFDELKAFSTRLRTRFESGDELDMESVVQILRERSMDPGSIDPESGLESFLQRRQREFINAHHSVSADPAATLKDLGVDSILEDAKSYLGEAPLIYPDLLS